MGRQLSNHGVHETGLRRIFAAQASPMVYRQYARERR